MKTFSYTIKDEVGIHARPAGLLTKKAKEFKSVITLEKNGKTGCCHKAYGNYEHGREMWRHRKCYCGRRR